MENKDLFTEYLELERKLDMMTLEFIDRVSDYFKLVLGDLEKVSIYKDEEKVNVYYDNEYIATIDILAFAPLTNIEYAEETPNEIEPYESAISDLNISYLIQGEYDKVEWFGKSPQDI